MPKKKLVPQGHLIEHEAWPSSLHPATRRRALVAMRLGWASGRRYPVQPVLTEQADYVYVMGRVYYTAAGVRAAVRHIRALYPDGARRKSVKR